MPEGQATAVFAQLRPIYGGWERGGGPGKCGICTTPADIWGVGVFTHRKQSPCTQNLKTRKLQLTQTRRFKFMRFEQNDFKISV